jgi:hypothetical protein
MKNVKSFCNVNFVFDVARLICKELLIVSHLALRWEWVDIDNNTTLTEALKEIKIYFQR